MNVKNLELVATSIDDNTNECGYPTMDGLEVEIRGSFTLKLGRSENIEHPDYDIDAMDEKIAIEEVINNNQELYSQIADLISFKVNNEVQRMRQERSKACVVYKVVHVNGGCYESVVSQNKLAYKLGLVTTGNFVAAFSNIKDARAFQRSHAECVVLKCEATAQYGTPDWALNSPPQGTVFCSSVKPTQLMG